MNNLLVSMLLAFTILTNAALAGRARERLRRVDEYFYLTGVAIQLIILFWWMKPS